MTWPKFYSEICGRLRVNPDQAQLEYRIISSGMYSSNSPLDMELEWSLAMMSVCRGCQENQQIEIEILELIKPVSYLAMVLI